jgi:soluble lytic murein transglycosylase-like protein
MAENLAGAQLLAGLLSLPQQIQNQRQTALDEDAIRKSFVNNTVPTFSEAPPVGGTGAVGKVMSGMGTVGAALSTALGNPVKPPRMDLGALSNIANVRLQQSKIENFQRGADALAAGNRQEAMKYFGMAGSMKGVEIAGRGFPVTSKIDLFRQQAENEGLSGTAATARIAQLISDDEQAREDRATKKALTVQNNRYGLVQQAKENDRRYVERRWDDLTAVQNAGTSVRPESPLNLPQVQQWKPHSQRIANIVGVDPVLFHTMLAYESRGQGDAVSPKGASGLMQVMPAEFDKLRPQIEALTGRPADPTNREDQLFAGALHLKNDLAMAHGDIGDALRMYNAGPDKKKWNNPETRNYVQNVYGDYLAQRDTQQPAAPAAPGTPPGDPQKPVVKNIRIDGRGGSINIAPPGGANAGKPNSQQAASAGVLSSLDAAINAVENGKGNDGKPLMMSDKEMTPWTHDSKYPYMRNLERKGRGYLEGGARVEDEFAKGNKDAAAIKQFVVLMRPLIARAFGDTGNISDASVKMLAEGVGVERFPKEQAAQALRTLKAMLASAAEGKPIGVVNPRLVDQQGAQEALNQANEQDDPESIMGQYGH